MIRALAEHVPSWQPHRYGWSEPLRHTFQAQRFDHFWSQAGYWRNAARPANASVDVRTGPWDILSKVEISGAFTPELKGDGLGAFLADCGAALDISYAMAHLFTDEENSTYYRDWFELPPGPDSVKKAAQGTMPYFLRDLYWANVFGPPYTELFGLERLRTAPAAVAAHRRGLLLRPRCPCHRTTSRAPLHHSGRGRTVEAGQANPHDRRATGTAGESTEP